VRLRIYDLRFGVLGFGYGCLGFGGKYERQGVIERESKRVIEGDLSHAQLGGRKPRRERHPRADPLPRPELGGVLR
jgi:hypothetical protein